MNTLALPYGSFWWRDMLRKAVMRIMAQRQDYGIGKAVVNDSARIEGARVAGSPYAVYFTANAPNGTLLTGYPWTDPLDVRPGLNQWTHIQTVGFPADNAIVQSNTARLTGGGGFVYAIDSGLADCTIAVLVQALTGRLPVVVARSNLLAGAANRHWAFALIETSFLRIYEFTGAGYVLQASSAIALVNGDWYLTTVALAGNNLSVTIGATTVSFVSGSYATNTSHGLEEASGGAGNAFFDTFTVAA